MLFILWFKFEPDNTHKVIELWKHFRYPSEIDYQPVPAYRQAHIAGDLDAQDEESLIKVVGPFAGLGVAHVTSAIKA